ncbi:MAG: FAD:protein FMN transferase [Deltaproteobacteria bacterium]|nr:FAD:protein FMN transferase [Deltaproteobacteria bacterium]
MKRRRLLLLIPLLLFLAILVASLYGRRSREYASDQFLMDTLISIKVYGRDPKVLKSAVSAAYAEMHRIAELVDGFPQPGTAAYNSSDVCRINRQAGLQPVRVDPDVIAMLLLAKKYNELSDGAFDVTVGPLMDLWGFGGDSPHIPPPEQIRSALALIGSRDLLLDSRQQTAFLRRRGMKLDLGAIAKGYATEKALQTLKKYGIRKALIDAGGNIRVLGRNQHDTSWSIGIRDPRKPDGIVAILPLEDAAAVTSGDYYRYFEAGGVRYHHILDPRSGYPATGNMTVTAIAADAGLADVFSTLFFVLPPHKAMEAAARLGGVDIFLVTANRRILHTPSLKGRIEILSGGGYHYEQGR